MRFAKRFGTRGGGHTDLGMQGTPLRLKRLIFCHVKVTSMKTGDVLGLSAMFLALRPSVWLRRLSDVRAAFR